MRRMHYYERTCSKRIIKYDDNDDDDNDADGGDDDGAVDEK